MLHVRSYIFNLCLDVDFFDLSDEYHAVVSFAAGELKNSENGS